MSVEHARLAVQAAQRRLEEAQGELRRQEELHNHYELLKRAVAALQNRLEDDPKRSYDWSTNRALVDDALVLLRSIMWTGIPAGPMEEPGPAKDSSDVCEEIRTTLNLGETPSGGSAAKLARLARGQ